ncbi:MAG: hypothetical protein H0V78_00845, partial [Burkholderiales bacterium]|nr:hypothetical protein [Burkholderiales bacterium]
MQLPEQREHAGLDAEDQRERAAAPDMIRYRTPEKSSERIEQAQSAEGRGDDLRAEPGQLLHDGQRVADHE